MKSGILINIDELYFLDSKKLSLTHTYQSLDETVKKIMDSDEFNVKKYINNGIIDVSSFSRDAFKIPKKIHFFISYSSKDKEKANQLAAFLSNLGFIVFADNQEWENMYILLKKFDKIICYKSKTTYDYDKRNITTANIHSILSIALAKVIRVSDYFVVLESENSLKFENNKYITTSPWLEYELEIFNSIVPCSRFYDNIKLLDESYSTDKYTWNREYNLQKKYFSFLDEKGLQSLEKCVNNQPSLELEKILKNNKLKMKDETLFKNIP